ncbi:MAG: hypothetical protein LBM41_04810 [Ruminococcus sp.]|jgi:hypothetical protein|nr:hypothetical protein [Ruminococcus sp.]
MKKRITVVLAGVCLSAVITGAFFLFLHLLANRSFHFEQKEQVILDLSDDTRTEHIISAQPWSFAGEQYVIFLLDRKLVKVDIKTGEIIASSEPFEEYEDINRIIELEGGDIVVSIDSMRYPHDSMSAVTDSYYCKFTPDLKLIDEIPIPYNFSLSHATYDGKFYLCGYRVVTDENPTLITFDEDMNILSEEKTRFVSDYDIYTFFAYISGDGKPFAHWISKTGETEYKHYITAFEPNPSEIIELPTHGNSYFYRDIASGGFEYPIYINYTAEIQSSDSEDYDIIAGVMGVRWDGTIKDIPITDNSGNNVSFTVFPIGGVQTRDGNIYMLENIDDVVILEKLEKVYD